MVLIATQKKYTHQLLIGCEGEVTLTLADIREVCWYKTVLWQNMYKADLPPDESVLRAVERRRAAEAERKNRIFSTRTRVIGVDPRALHKQREEKLEHQEMEKQRDMAHGTTNHFCTNVTSVLQNKLQHWKLMYQTIIL